MADVGIEGSFSGNAIRAFRNIVFVSADVGYLFAADGTLNDLYYRKTTDGGATWGSPVEIDTDTDITLAALDVWYDRWTPGDTGTKIHIAWSTTDNDDVVYRALDTNGDSLGTQVNAFVGVTAVNGIGCHVSITKAVGGRLYISYQLDAGAEVGAVQSTDGGANWGAIASPFLATPSGDWTCLLPAANTGDTNDVLALYHDASANSLLLRWHDDSADTWTSSSSIATVAENTTDGTGQFPFSASIRHGDGKLFLAVVSERDTATADHLTFELDRTAGAFAITAKGNITTNIDDHYYPSVFIDQTTDDIYVAYTGKRDGTETLGTTAAVYYTKSTDDGANWSAGDTAYMEAAGTTVLQTWAPLMGDRFYTIFRVSGTVTLYGNKVNSVTFGAAVIPSLLMAPPQPAGWLQ